MLTTGLRLWLMPLDCGGSADSTTTSSPVCSTNDTGSANGPPRMEILPSLTKATPCSRTTAIALYTEDPHVSDFVRRSDQFRICCRAASAKHAHCRDNQQASIWKNAQSRLSEWNPSNDPFRRLGQTPLGVDPCHQRIRHRRSSPAEVLHSSAVLQVTLSGHRRNAIDRAGGSEAPKGDKSQ